MRIILLILFLNIFYFDMTMSQDSDDFDLVKELRIGYLSSELPVPDLKAGMVALELWAGQIAEDIGTKMTVLSKFYEKFDDIKKDIIHKKLDFFSIPILLYIENKDSLNVTPVIVEEHSTGPLEDYVLLVHKDSDVKRLIELKGKSLLVQTNNPRSCVSLLWLNKVLLDNDFDESEVFFKHVEYTVNLTKVVLPVVFKNKDACILSNENFNIIAELNPQVKNDLVILQRSPEFLTTLMLIRNDLPDKVKDKIVYHALNAPKNPRGRQIMNLFKVENLGIFKKEYLDSVVKLTNEYDQLKNSKQ